MQLIVADEERRTGEAMDENDREENDPLNSSSLQMDARDVNESEMETMKGDTIGDTMYSAKWIINVLISLSNVYEKGWSESLESELCLLWDMTTEKDVTLFLEENNFFKIAEVSLKVSEGARMTEILVGILGNMCCQPSVIRSLAERKELVSLLLNLLGVDDTETLIQLLRLLRVAVWDIQLQTANNSNSLWLEHLKNCPIFGTSLIFILKSSTNDDLLITATDLVQSISTTNLPDEKFLEVLFNIEDLLPALLESFTQIIPKQDGNHTKSELKVIENWLTILSNIMEKDQSMFAENQHNQDLINILDTLLRILQPYVHSHNLIPLDERSAVCIHECVKLILKFQQNGLPVGPEIVFIIVTIMFHLKSASKSTDLESNSDNNERELSMYLEKYWFEILDMYEGNQLHDILQMCEENIVKYVMDMTKSHLQTTSDKMEKLTIANDSVNQ